MCLTSSGYSGISSFANSKKIDHNLLSTPSVLSVSRNESASMPVDNEEDREDVVGGKKKKEKSGGAWRTRRRSALRRELYTDAAGNCWR